jgi:hypothetical protein
MLAFQDSRRYLLTEDEKNLPVRYYMIILSATNKCMAIKEWRTEKQKTGEEGQQ